MDITYIPEDKIDLVWSGVAPMLKKALDLNHGRYHMDDVYNGLLKGTYQLWIIYKNYGNVLAAVVTEVVTYPRKKSLLVFLAGGQEHTLWVGPLLETLKSCAKALGCDFVESFARIGWQKSLQKLGIKPRHQIYEIIV